MLAIQNASGGQIMVSQQLWSRHSPDLVAVQSKSGLCLYKFNKENVASLQYLDYVRLYDMSPLSNACEVSYGCILTKKAAQDTSDDPIVCLPRIRIYDN